MIYSFDDLALKFRDYTDIKGKISREVKAGNLFPVIRGMYETEATTEGKYLAGRIYGPSYLSFDYALSVYSLIPEAVYHTYTSATFKKNRSKKYHNQFGIFTYRDISPEAYPYGVLLHEDNDCSYQIASPEKALCDKLYTLPPIQNQKELQALLFEDLRIDEQLFFGLNFDDIEQLIPMYHSTNLNLLGRFIRRK